MKLHLSQAGKQMFPHKENEALLRRPVSVANFRIPEIVTGVRWGKTPPFKV